MNMSGFSCLLTMTIDPLHSWKSDTKISYEGRRDISFVLSSSFCILGFQDILFIWVICLGWVNPESWCRSYFTLLFCRVEVFMSYIIVGWCTFLFHTSGCLDTQPFVSSCVLFNTVWPGRQGWNTNAAISRYMHQCKWSLYLSFLI